MNKLFIILLVVLVALPSYFVAAEGLSDFERSLEPMKLGDIWAKLGEGKPLTSQEVEFLRLQGNMVQDTTAITSGWIGADQQPHVGTIYADAGVFSVLPIGASLFMYNGSHVIANSTTTTLDFSTYRYYDSTSILVPYNNDTTKFHINPLYSNAATKALLVTLYYHGVAQESGYHSCSLLSYLKSDDSIISTIVLGTSDNTSGWVAGGVTFPLSIEYLESITGADISALYFKVAFYQSSGGDATLAGYSINAQLYK